MTAASDSWPALPLAAWKDTYATLHMWTQIVGKIRLALTPPVNHWWHVTLYVTARGLTTSPMPAGERSLELTFDFVDHRLHAETSDGDRRHVQLAPMPVRDFYHLVMRALEELRIEVRIWPMPAEVPSPIRFDQDRVHASYDAVWAERWWRVVRQTHHVFQEFRGRFVGKSSPVHFFWGGFDLAVTRFSGRRAPERDDPVNREAYSHEVLSAGFWPGGSGVADAAFYAYAAPEPQGFSNARILPASASYNSQLGEFILMYEDVRSSPSPQAVLMDFLQTTYEAGAALAGWDRAGLERAS